MVRRKRRGRRGSRGRRTRSGTARRVQRSTRKTIIIERSGRSPERTVYEEVYEEEW